MYQTEKVDAARADPVTRYSCPREIHRGANTRSYSGIRPSRLCNKVVLLPLDKRGDVGNRPRRMGEIGLCAGSRDRYSFGMVASNTLHANGPYTLSSSGIGRDTGILPKMDADVVGENVECTLAQDPIGPIRRL